MKKIYHILSFTLILTLFLQVNATGEIIGIDNFDYPNGDIAGRAGGMYWDWNNETYTHTGTASDWNNVFGSANVQNQALLTDNGGALREYNGPTEGVEGDEGDGAFKAVGKAYYSVTMTQLAANEWCGFSVYDFGSERVFFGQPYQTASPRYFGVEVSGVATVLSDTEIILNETYGLIGVQDFDGNQLRLWINPDADDYDNSYLDNTADVIISYTGTNWNSAVRFASGSQTVWDNVMVSNKFDDLLRKAAINPYPATGAENVKLDVTLSWDPGRDPNDPDMPNPDITRHFLYMSSGDPEDPNLYFVTEIPNDGDRASYGPLSLEMDKKYKWRVDEGIGTYPEGDPNNIEGYVWNFAAVTTKPIIDPDYPVDQIVDAGGTAEFTVIASNPFAGHETEITYEWYKDNAALTDGDTVQGSTISGVTTDVLTISNVQLEDEGQYFCRVTNTYGNTASADSSSAILTVKRMLAYWPFDDANDPNSVVAGSPATTTYGDPEFVSGIVGSAVLFDGDDAFYTELAQGDYFEACDRNMTICCFMKSSGQALWSPFVSKYGENGLGWQLRQNGFASDRVSFTTRGTDAEDGSYSSMSVYDDQWHFVAGTFDSAEKKLYIDGALDQTDLVTGPVAYSNSPVAIAARLWEDEGWWIEGFATVTLDEVRIYNYSMDKYEIADLYINAAGGYICVEGYPEADLDKNCLVDLNDFAIIAAKWLECGLYPSEGNCP